LPHEMPTHYIQANTNGRLHPASEPSITPLNRGFLYGDVIFAWEEHWKRLGESSRALHMPIDLTMDQVLAEVKRTVAQFRSHSPEATELYIRLQIARGAGPIGLDIALADRTNFIILVQPCPDLEAEKWRTGLRLSVAKTLRRNPAESLDPADDVVILNLAGEVAEASVANIGFVRSGRIVTPPLSAGILGGITRKLVLDGIAKSAGLDALEASVRPADFTSMEECFLLSTTKDIVPVGEIDGIRFAVGPDTATSRLKSAFSEAAKAYARAHPAYAA